MEALWTHQALSVREIQETFPEANRPAYTTVQTMVYRLEQKKALRRVRKIGNAHIFEAIVSQASADAACCHFPKTRKVRIAPSPRATSAKLLRRTKRLLIL